MQTTLTPETYYHQEYYQPQYYHPQYYQQYPGTASDGYGYGYDGYGYVGYPNSEYLGYGYQPEPASESLLPQWLTKSYILPLIIILIWAVVFVIWGYKKAKEENQEIDPFDHISSKLMGKYIDRCATDSTDFSSMASMFTTVGLSNMFDMEMSPMKMGLVLILFMFSAHILKAWATQHDDDEADMTNDAADGCYAPGNYASAETVGVGPVQSS